MRTMENKTFVLLAVYGPPQQSSISKFTDEFLDLMEELIVQHKELIILGDFNIQLNYTEDNYVKQFTDSMEALGFEQHIKFTTHTKGNILDHIYSELGSDISEKNVSADELISDHHWIIGNLSIKKSKLVREARTTKLQKDRLQ